MWLKIQRVYVYNFGTSVSEYPHNFVDDVSRARVDNVGTIIFGRPAP